jgi:hypothetical protein
MARLLLTVLCMSSETIYVKKGLNITKIKEIGGMKRLFGFVFIVFFLSWGQAFADYSFTFTSNDGSINASGMLFTASNSGPGPVTVTGGYISGTYGNATIYPAAVTSGYLTSPGGAFWYDNQLYPGTSSQPSFTWYGLLFTTGTFGTSDYKEINLWSNSAAQNDYTLMQWTQAGGYSVDNTDTRGTATVPIPGAVLLFAPGLAGIALLRRRNKQ